MVATIEPTKKANAQPRNISAVKTRYAHIQTT